MDDYLKYIALIVAVLCGGLGGAVLTNFISAYRNRIQPIARHVAFFHVFSADNQIKSDLKAYITLEDGNKVEKFDNLMLANIIVTNKGNEDYPSFTFGITHNGGDQAIHVKSEPPDRAHIATVSQVNLQQPSSDIDFTLTPFNRSDTYSFEILVVVPNENKNHGLVEFSTAHPIKFVQNTEIRNYRWNPTMAIAWLVIIFSLAFMAWYSLSSYSEIRRLQQKSVIDIINQ